MSSPVNTQIIILRPRIPVLVGTLVALSVYRKKHAGI
jgi:hypothetical protein